LARQLVHPAVGGEQADHDDCVRVDVGRVGPHQLDRGGQGAVHLSTDGPRPPLQHVWVVNKTAQALVKLVTYRQIVPGVDVEHVAVPVGIHLPPQPSPLHNPDGTGNRREGHEVTGEISNPNRHTADPRAHTAIR
jgi:hypothetical protein